MGDIITDAIRKERRDIKRTGQTDFRTAMLACSAPQHVKYWLPDDMPAFKQAWAKLSRRERFRRAQGVDQDID